MIKILSYITVVLIGLNFARAADTNSVDIQEVVVEEKSEPSNNGFNYLSNQSLSEKYLKQINPVQVSDALQYISGVNIRDYGGLSSVQTVSLRGLPSNQTLVLFDGMNITNSQTGLTDVSKLFISSVDKIEVAKGASSSLYGSNAIAGVVNLNTGNTMNNNYGMMLSYDAFTNRIAELDLTQNIDSVPFTLKLRKTDSEGTYGFRFNGEEFERNNSAVNNIDLYLGSIFTAGGFVIKPRLIARQSKRGAPEPVIGGVQRESNAFLKEADLLALVTATNYIDDSTNIKLGLSYNYSDLQFRNPNAIEFGANGIDNDYYNNSTQFRAQFNKWIGKWYYSIVADGTYAQLNGDMLQEVGDDNIVTRGNGSLAANLSYTKQSVVIEYSYFGSMRADFSTDFAANYAPMVGISANVMEANFLSKFSISGGYRLPSFNEMYYLNYGNQDLKPESALSYNLGFEYSPPAIGSFGVNLFYTFTNDQIAAVPTGPITWQSQNIDKVESRGIELTALFRLMDNLAIRYNYIYQLPTNETLSTDEESILLPYTPEEVISAMLTYEHESLLTGLSTQYKSYVFTTIDNDMNLILDNFFLIDFFVSYRPELFGGDLELRADIENITDQQYQLFLNFPMPGRNIRATIRYEL
ncbi:MAG: TonB-dependent receptor plug domain-containing protein [Chlorobiota bacterium]